MGWIIALGYLLGGGLFCGFMGRADPGFDDHPFIVILSWPLLLCVLIGSMIGQAIIKK